MQTGKLIRAGIFALLNTIIMLFSWEINLRESFFSKLKGLKQSYDNNPVVCTE